ncbi:sugar transferase [Micromonospora sp. NBC_01699]|uniref:sugar transferase n=1 Tax=Micromonospora sp. NBC_01699 TaxID=2975984 RepID=UPI002E3038DD|nr:sugar transferase [Micromonospora sp. NBC_01699]
MLRKVSVRPVSFETGAAQLSDAAHGLLAPPAGQRDDLVAVIRSLAETGEPQVTTPTDAPAGRPSRGLVRAVVVESTAEPIPADRLGDEFDVMVRLPLAQAVDLLDAVLTRYRPKLLLLKHSLDSVDERLMAACLAHDVEIWVLARPVYGLLRPARLRRFGGLPWLRLQWSTRWPGKEPAKRCVDLALALLTAPLSIPLMTLIMAAVSCSGPPLYFQTRVGAGGRPFRMVKFRTMRVDAERDTGPVLVAVDDSRITRVGRLLRRSRLDELPQLWNVLRGEMSLVGPRPERPEFVADFRRLPHYDLRHRIRPGMTGIAQLTGGYAATVEEKLRCDLLYLNCRSVRLDLTLLTLTVIDLFRGFPRG